MHPTINSKPSLETATLRIAVVDPLQAQPTAVRALFTGQSWCRCDYYAPDDLAKIGRESYDILVWVDSQPTLSAEHLDKLIDRRVELLVIITERASAFRVIDTAHVCLPPDSTVELLHGAIVGLTAARPALAKAHAEQSQMRRVSEGVLKHVDAMDAELRLASRLQLNFLPSENLQIGPASFSTMYRPCSWVSGDIFDIFRVDDEIVEFYLADAMGHGVAAGLLTMYVKNAIDAQRLAEHSQQPLSPGKALAQLNDRLVAEGLDDARFVTCWYGVLNTRTLDLRYAVAGHPPSIWISGASEIRELLGDGGLLGLESGQEFAERTVTLSSGDRIVVYSDGLEGVLIADRQPLPQIPEWVAGIPELLALPTAKLLTGLEQRLDRLPGSLNKADDASVIVVDIGC